MPVEKDTAFFSVSGLAKHFGGIHAVEGLSFALARGEIVGLIGPNGSGKTTTINMVTGALKPDGGAILVEGTDMARSPANLFARRGVARTFQVPRLFRRMTVLENLIVPALSDPAERRAAAEERARGVLAFLRLDHLADSYARALSGGQQKLLELGRALMLKPRLLLLDEPFAGVHPRLLEEIIEHIRSLNRDGHTIVVVDHNLEAIQSVVTRVMVMARGRKIADGAVAEVLRNPEVVHAYTGSRATHREAR
ncbi:MULTISPECIES: ABC transporter ATP-binding protein [unclassified Mesorhizobium]|uniref:ABC transporter ATP-binding protein n=1 Tax=unclassified Mesorhizobium TaxID=325217 RepID=UPI00112D4B1D|nr:MULTISPECIES: ATP-binding cassette domain-containing protein [unclassified Mesorhizobium]MBZ9704320.1 ATP-binding cassette domain-containing protein [Mesorhizobium sp. CO1-1-3]MBZ9896061.1 ATP-binding cassette domain-containing protein [Mesorhizobium sp. BR1-1-6]MBZ9950849.1 ATP-binding cassette domain-containing protein [Mesorhizobium sp. BR1-1-11]MCA0025845.1 ATP-binding cassette domain-containing protein [Mesorhizobium sp. B263B1A]TPI95082.1 ATP-binding cassette domain-containing protein